MNPVEEIMQRMKLLRDGKIVICKHCNQGEMKPIGDYRTTNCFVCNKCGNKLNIN